MITNNSAEDTDSDEDEDIQDMYVVIFVLSLCHSPCTSFRDDDEKGFYCKAYKDIIKFIPELKKLLPASSDGCSGELNRLLARVSHVHISHNTTTNYCIDAERMQ